MLTYSSDHKIKNLIIILVVSALAFQTLYFLYSFSVNIPRQDEWGFVPFIADFYDGEDFWQHSEFWQYGHHRQIIYNLLTLANVTLASWNVVYQMYFGWGMLVLAVWIIFLILRKTMPNLNWLIILIAAFLFNTSQTSTLLQALGNSSFIATTGIFASIYFLSKKEFKGSTLIFATSSAWIASFSEIHGLTIWIVGMFSMFHRTKRTHLIIWLINTVVVFFLFFATFDFSDPNLPPEVRGKIDIETLFTLDGIQFIITFLANGLIPHLDAFYPVGLPTGAVIISLIVGGPVYLHFKKMEIGKIMPWIQLGMIGIMTATMTAIGRVGEESPMAIRYMPMAALSQISALIIASIILIQIYNNCTNNKKKRIVAIFFSVMIILVSIGLGVSYVSGWYVGGVYWHPRLDAAFECMTKSNSDLICPDLFMPPNIPNNLETLSNNAEMLKQRHLGPFADSNNLKKYSRDPLLETQNWKNLEKVKGVDGSIDHIDEQSVISSKEIHVVKSKILIQISGWGIFDEKSPKIDSAYLFIDNDVQSKLRIGLLDEKIAKKYGIIPGIFSGWEGWIDLRPLSNEKCHNISVRLVKGTQYYEILGKVDLCI